MTDEVDVKVVIREKFGPQTRVRNSVGQVVTIISNYPGTPGYEGYYMTITTETGGIVLSRDEMLAFFQGFLDSVSWVEGNKND